VRVVSFKIFEEDYERLEAYAKRRNIPVSELVRRAVLAYIEADRDKPYYGKYLKITFG
jgi:predicted DNA-binding protein